MTVVARVREEFSAWIASVAEAIVAGSSRFGAQQQVRLVETEQNTFVMSMTAKSSPAPHRSPIAPALRIAQQPPFA